MWDCGLSRYLSARPTRIVLAIAVIAVSPAITDCSSPSPAVGETSPRSASSSVSSETRERARALAQSGQFQDALKIYDDLTAAGTRDINLLIEADDLAAKAGVPRYGAIFKERKHRLAPGDFNERNVIPFLYRLGGDEANALRSANELIAAWKASTDQNIRSQPRFVIDSFRVGTWDVTASQCFEVADDFGVGYIFFVFMPGGQRTAERLHAMVVLEHERFTYETMKKRDPNWKMKPSLDGFFEDAHVTLNWFDEEPTYAALRPLVETFVGRLQPGPRLSPRWAGITCLVSQR